MDYFSDVKDLKDWYSPVIGQAWNQNKHKDLLQLIMIDRCKDKCLNKIINKVENLNVSHSHLKHSEWDAMDRFQVGDSYLALTTVKAENLSNLNDNGFKLYRAIKNHIDKVNMY